MENQEQKKQKRKELIISISPFIVAGICTNLFPQLEFLPFIFIALGILLVIKYKPHLQASNQINNESSNSSWDEDDRELEDL